MTGKGRSQNKSKREEEARSRGFVGADRESWVAAALTRAARRLQKKRNRRAACPLPGQRLSIFSISSPERAKKLSIGVHGFCGRQRKSTASGQGEGSWKPGKGVEKGEPQITQSSPDLGYGSWMTGETIRKERA